MATSRRLHLVATVVVLVTATSVGLLVAMTGGDRQVAGAETGLAPPGAVDVSLSDCGSGWAPGPAGAQELTLHNADYRSGEVRVVGVDPAHARQVFAELEPFGPGTTVTMHVRLAAGQYALQCLFDEQSPLTGPARTISGDGPGVRGVVPIPQNQLVRATLRYTQLVRGRLPRLEEQTRSLARAVAAGNLGEAKRLWLLAHAGYERLGAAYDAFGDLDGVDQRAARRTAPGGPRPRLHRLPPGRDGAVGPLVDGTRRATSPGRGAGRCGERPARRAGRVQLDPLTFSIRAHEIAENLLRPVLTGRADFGSHSDLATVAAGLDGTRTVLALVRKPLKTRYPHVRGCTARSTGPAGRRPARTRATGPHGDRDWPLAQRQRVDALVAELAERLAPVASVLEPRRTT